MLVALMIVLLLLAIFAFPAWPYAAGWGLGYWPSGILALLFIVLLFAALSGGWTTRSRDPMV